MSDWTVEEKKNANAPTQGEDRAISDLVNQVVDDEGNATKAPDAEETANAVAAETTAPVEQETAPTNQAEGQGTPSKEGGMDSFNNWVRQQGTTPNGAPQQNGGGGGSGPYNGEAANPKEGEGSPLKTESPSLMPNDPNYLQGGGTLDAIQEQRRQLMMQMEELQMAEADIRRNGSGNLMSPYENNSPYSPNGQPQQQLTLDSVRGRIYETAKDQHGCRFLQRLLDQGQQESIEAAQVILSEILQNIPELMTDQYANFLVQKLFDMMPHDVRYTVAQVAAPHLCTISLTPHGTFSVQKLIETIATREEMEVVQNALKIDVVQLVKDVHGNHVIQKVLQRFEHADTQFIYDALTTDCVAIATNKQGCCVLQRCLEYANDPQRHQMVSAIVQAALTLVQDPFGNYVVQYVLDGKEVVVNDAIAELFLPHIVMLSTNKFSSNVVEKVVKGCSNAAKEKYVMTLFDQNTLMRLLRDDYGNYVVQTALTEAPYHLAEQLVMCIRPIMHHIRNAPYAKKLEAKMDLVLKKKAGFSPHRGPRNHHDHHGHHGGHGGPYGMGHPGHHGGHHHHHHHHHHHMGGRHPGMNGSPTQAEAGFGNGHHNGHQQGGHGGPQGGHPGMNDQHRPFRATAAPWSPQLSMEQQQQQHMQQQQ